MDKAPDEDTGGLARELGLPLLTLLGTGALTIGRLTQGAPVDGLSFTLHLLGSLAALRMAHPLVRLFRAPSGEAGAPPLPASASLSPSFELPPGPARTSPADTFDAFVSNPDHQPGAQGLPAGRAWLLSGPYAGLVFALLLGLHALAVPLLRTPLTLSLLPIACAPLALWWWRGRATRRARAGVALLLTPTQLIVRDAVGARSAPWSELQALRVESQPAWDMLRGARRAPLLLISRRGNPPIALRQDDLGVPVPQALAWVEAYRAAVLAAPEPTAGSDPAVGAVSAALGS